MRPITVLVALLCTTAGAAGLAGAYAHRHRPLPVQTTEFEAGKPRIKLAVLVVFDQMRGDYLEQWRGLFGRKGFARLESEGAWFTHCNYPYATTTTGPGHASMLSGTCGDRHGIINNSWFERGESVYCAGSREYKLVPPAPSGTADAKGAKEGKGKPKDGGTPERLLSETVADVLRAAHPNSKIFSFSLKDRSAILPVGKEPSGAYWFDGRFVTSSYYPNPIHPWVEAFNSQTEEGKGKGSTRWFGKDWIPSRPDVKYFDWLDPEVVKANYSKAVLESGEPAFRHPNTGGKSSAGKEYFEHLANSPYGNELLLEMAKRCTTAESLGKHKEPDLLVVSFSSNDLIGHAWGPDSPEVLDVTVRSDAIVAELLGFLDSEVGKGEYLLAITADHGVCPTVDAAKARHIGDAERVSLKSLNEAIESHLTARFGVSNQPKDTNKKPLWIEAFAERSAATFPWIYLNSPPRGVSREEVARATVEFLATRPQVARAFTRSDLAVGFPESDIIGNRVRRSYHPVRSGDVYVLLKPYCLPGEGIGDQATTHGTPYGYDTHVPLIVYGPGIVGGVRTEPVTPQAAAAIFSKWLGTRLPNKAEYPVPATLLAN